MSERVVAGEVVAAFLEGAGVRAAFGVISIHNMPILDAICRRGAIRAVPARGEAGAVNMADAFARVSGGVGVAVTSTGTGCGNAAGAMVEAFTAGTPLLHITGQIEVPYLDRERAYIHEAPDQLGMLDALSKAAFRVWTPETLLGTLRKALAVALTPPRGPVSVEIPIDVQSALIAMAPPEELLPLAPAHAPLDRVAVDAIADELASARRPLLWLGGGARDAVVQARRFADAGWGVISSVNGRGIVPEHHPASLGAYTTVPAVERLYTRCDAMLVVGSRLRSNETLKYKLQLPEPLYEVNVDSAAPNRSYAVRRFAAGDAAEALERLARRLLGTAQVDPQFARDLATTRAQAERDLRASLGPYASLVDALRSWIPPDAPWVRDVTVSNSTWGNRYLPLHSARAGVHAVGGGIGQGLPMAIGAALAADRKTVALTGDGGLTLCLGELATLVQERADVLLIVMNDGGYGVIRNIQDAQGGGRRYLADLCTPDFQLVARALGLAAKRVGDAESFANSLEQLGAIRGPALLEVNMAAVGAFAKAFVGPPVRPAVQA